MTLESSQEPASGDRQVTVLRGRAITPTAVIDDAAVVLRGAWIAWVGDAAHAAAEGWGDEVAATAANPDAVLLPGLVDIHNHGGGGASFPDARTPGDVARAVREHRNHGTTSMFASMVTADPQTLLVRTATLADAADAGVIAGIHAEGPFISTTRCGAQNPADIRAGDPDEVRALAEAARGHLRTMTVAPEADGVVDRAGVIETLVSLGAIPSLGHTDATTEQTERAISVARASLDAVGRTGTPITATHLFNGMRPLHHRSPGPIPACLAAAARGDMVVELVADGVHLDPALVRNLASLLARHEGGELGARESMGAFAFVTDAMAAAGMADGTYQLGPMNVTVAGGVARLSGGDSIAGGTSHLIDQVRIAVASGIDIVDAVRAASLTPALAGGLEHIGALALGWRANLLVTDAKFKPIRVLVDGVDVRE